MNDNEELKRLYENKLTENNNNGIIVINYATLCRKQNDYERAINLLEGLIENIKNYEFKEDTILGEKYPGTIPSNIWKYISALMIKDLIEKRDLLDPNLYLEHKTNIKYLPSLIMNIMSLYADGSFRPENKLTRAEVIKIVIDMIWELQKPYEKYEYERNHENFKEILGHWGEEYIRIALSIGIIKSDNLLPNEDIMIEEAEEILSKAMEFINRIESKETDYKTKIQFPYFDNNIYVTREIMSQLIDAFLRTYYEDKVDNLLESSDHTNAIVSLFIIIIRNLKSNKCSKSSLLLMDFLYANYLDEFKKIDPEQVYLYSLIIFLTKEDKETAYRYLYDISTCIENIRKNHFVDINKRIKVVHYTSLQTLKALTIDKSKFRLSNVEYLNDPKEGAFFKALLKRYWKNQGFIKQMDCFKKAKEDSCILNNTYVASFMDSEDELPLWIHYGDRAEGCSITFNKHIFSGRNTTFFDRTSGKYSLYKVSYLSKDIKDIGADNLNQLDNIFRELEHCWSRENKKCQDIVLSFADNMIEQIAYLFKDKSYQYENEMRIIGFSQIGDAKSVDCSGEIFPRIVLEMEEDIRIDEIVFGPKVIKANEKALALLKNNAVNDLCNIRKSKIKYK